MEIPTAELTDSQLADEYSEFRARMMAWKPNVNPDAQRFSQLGTELLKRQEKEPAEKQIQVQGERYIVPISARERKRTIVAPIGLYRKLKKLGEKKIVALYKITLAAIDKAIPDEKERGRYVHEDRTGSREIGEPVLKDAA